MLILIMLVIIYLWDGMFNVNKVFGFYIEVTHTHQRLVPPNYTRKQTLKSAERYITEELKSFEDKVLSSRERALARETLCYANLLERLLDELQPLQDMGRRLARLDVLCALAERAARLDLVQPELSEREGIEIRGGEHRAARIEVRRQLARHGHFGDTRLLVYEEDVCCPERGLKLSVG